MKYFTIFVIFFTSSVHAGGINYKEDMGLVFDMNARYGGVMFSCNNKPMANKLKQATFDYMIFTRAAYMKLSSLYRRYDAIVASEYDMRGNSMATDKKGCATYLKWINENINEMDNIILSK